jgi:hypothetical protein
VKVQIALYLAGSLLNYALVEGWLTGAIDRALWRHSRPYRRLQIRRSLVGWRLDYHGAGQGSPGGVFWREREALPKKTTTNSIGKRKKIEKGKAKNET